MWLSIIIPTYHDDQKLIYLLNQFSTVVDPGIEIIVVDGVRREKPQWLPSQTRYVACGVPNRGIQLQTGAQISKGTHLWFIHADSEIDIKRALVYLKGRDVQVGFCTLKFNNAGRRYGWLARTSNLRAKYLHLIFGDQGLYVERQTYLSSGGFTRDPIMEDWQLSRALVQHKHHFTQLPITITTSARRFEENGFWRTLLKMNFIKVLYLMHVSPQRIDAIYERK